MLLVAAIAKALAYDLARLAPLYRILSFLGLVLLAASFLYTRYRQQARRLL